MAMHERPAFLHVAGVTGIDHSCALHQFRANRAMRIVAIGTGHLAFDNGMMRRLVDLGALLFVTGEAALGLGQLVTDFVFCHMNLVATRTGNVV